jgi:hypothetical protein
MQPANLSNIINPAEFLNRQTGRAICEMSHRLFVWQFLGFAPWRWLRRPWAPWAWRRCRWSRRRWSAAGAPRLATPHPCCSGPSDLYNSCIRQHRLNIELDIRSLFGLLYTAACRHWLRPRNSPPPHPRIWAHIRGCYWSMVSQDRPHLSITRLFCTYVQKPPNTL